MMDGNYKELLFNSVPSAKRSLDALTRPEILRDRRSTGCAGFVCIPGTKPGRSVIHYRKPLFKTVLRTGRFLHSGPKNGPVVEVTGHLVGERAAFQYPKFAKSRLTPHTLYRSSRRSKNSGTIRETYAPRSFPPAHLSMSSAGSCLSNRNRAVASLWEDISF